MVVDQMVVPIFYRGERQFEHIRPVLLELVRRAVAAYDKIPGQL